MPTIMIRNVDRELHYQFKSYAKRRGETMVGALLRLMEQAVWEDAWFSGKEPREMGQVNATEGDKP